MVSDHDWPRERLVAFFRDGVDGFTASACSRCRKTANVPGGRAGWFCACGEHNVLSYAENDAPHDCPDLGPLAMVIRSAAIEARGSLRAVTLIIAGPDHSNDTHRWIGHTLGGYCEACGVDADDEAAGLPCSAHEWPDCLPPMFPSR